MKVVYLGHVPAYAAVCHREAELMAVFWHGGTGGLGRRARSMLAVCHELGITAVRHRRFDPVSVTMLRALEPELIVVGEYHFLLKSPVLRIPSLGTINIHAAPLPRYRGAHPINWMIINGETEGAVTCHYVNEGLDAGDIIEQRTFPIPRTETASDVRPKIEATGTRVLTDVLRRFRAQGRLEGTPQDESKALYTPPRRPSDGLVDWRQSPDRVYDFIRALAPPYPGAFASLGAETVHFWKAQLPSEADRAPSDAAPGTVIESSSEAVRVAVEGGTIRISEWSGGEQFAIGTRFNGRECEVAV